MDNKKRQREYYIFIYVDSRFFLVFLSLSIISNPAWMLFCFQENQDLLIKCISQDLGFSKGRPIAACLIYKSLLQWRSFEVERTNIFDRIIQTISAAIEVWSRMFICISYPYFFFLFQPSRLFSLSTLSQEYVQWKLGLTCLLILVHVANPNLLGLRLWHCWWWWWWILDFSKKKFRVLAI